MNRFISSINKFGSTQLIALCAFHFSLPSVLSLRDKKQADDIILCVCAQAFVSVFLCCGKGVCAYVHSGIKIPFTMKLKSRLNSGNTGYCLPVCCLKI